MTEDLEINVKVKFEIPADEAAMLVQRLHVKSGEKVMVIAPQLESLAMFDRFASAVRRILADAEIESIVFPHGTQLAVHVPDAADS